MMGEGSESYWIFKPDNAYRLTHVWQVLASETYPPPSLLNNGISFHYHYGAPAIVTFFYELGFDNVDGVYFNIIMPFLLLSGFFFVFLMAYKVAKSFLISFLVLCVYSFFFVNYLKVFDRVNSSLYSMLMSVWNGSLDYITNSSVFIFSDWFGNETLDITYVAFFSLFGFLTFIYVLNDVRKRLFLLVVLLPFVLFLKTELIIWVLFLLVVDVSNYFSSRFDLRKVLFSLFFLFFCVLSFSLLDGLISLPNANLIFSLNLNISVIPEKLFVFILIFLILLDSFLEEKNMRFTFLYFVCFSLLLVSISFVEIYLHRNDAVEAFSLTKRSFARVLHGIMLMGVIFYIIEKYDSFNGRYTMQAKNLVFFGLVFFVIALSFFKLYHLSIQYWILINVPEENHEAVNLVEYRQCLEKVPVAGSIIYSNYFEYPSGTLENKDLGMHLTAFFGHQAYAANSVYERYPEALAGVGAQKEILQNVNASIVSVCELMIDKSRQAYAIFDKKEAYPLSISPYISFENNTCAVFYASSDLCQEVY